MKVQKLNVLIVESNRFLLSILQETFKSDWNVTLASNGLEAMDLLERGLPVDCIITDLKLPKFNGLELIRMVRQTGRHQAVPILALSDSGDSATRIQSLENGADDCMAKPFNPLEVRAKIRAMLRRSGNALTRITKSGSADFQTVRFTRF
ncbi:response regulator transcription factor [Larkinella sp. VNQ87]|uniref:response regulator transcription factor n=1 Tax=Larkinella sp. VNQ87 TaxID=3400921 RepID=UPI003BFF61C3